MEFRTIFQLLISFSLLSLSVNAATVGGTIRQPTGPTEELASAPITPSTPSLKGVFIICERGVSDPEARLFTSTVAKKLDISLFLDCTSTLVKGDNGVTDDFNHANLWPLNGEEFDEMVAYRERQNSCNTGAVRVVRTNQDNSKTELYRCEAPWESHTVAFKVNLP